MLKKNGFWTYKQTKKYSFINNVNLFAINLGIPFH